jgi:hypothetical protein
MESILNLAAEPITKIFSVAFHAFTLIVMVVIWLAFSPFILAEAVIKKLNQAETKPAFKLHWKALFSLN